MSESLHNAFIVLELLTRTSTRENADRQDSVVCVKPVSRQTCDFLGFWVFCLIAPCILLTPTVASEQKPALDKQIYHSHCLCVSALWEFFFPCHLCLSHWRFHLPSIFRQTSVPDMSEICDPGNIVLCCSMAHIVWFDWKQDDLSECEQHTPLCRGLSKLHFWHAIIISPLQNSHCSLNLILTMTSTLLFVNVNNICECDVNIALSAPSFSCNCLGIEV